MKRHPHISPAAHATLTRPLIFEDGRFNRGAISAKARRDFRAGHARTWSKAMESAWALARRQLEKARQYDADRRVYRSAPAGGWPLAKPRREAFPQHAA
jgi:hypothetical protein